jgi:hypothetical protein
MLAEKFLMVLETLLKSQIRSTTYSDGAPRVMSSSQHVPVQLPAKSRTQEGLERWRAYARSTVERP